MRPEAFDRSFLSEREIHGLLGEGPLGGDDGESGPAEGGAAGDDDTGARAPGRVLVVSRRRLESDLFRARLEVLGLEVETVRNPFSALDRLRLDVHQGVISDFELWADDGALLLGRLERSGRALPVLFVAERSGDEARTEARVRRAGAWGILFRPVQAADLEMAARALLFAGRDGSECPRETNDGSEHGAALEEVEKPAHGPEGLWVSEARESSPSVWTDGPATNAAGDPLHGKTAILEEEAAWLRFHLELSRLARSPGPRSTRARRVVHLARESFGPRGVGVLFEEDGRLTAILEGAPGAGHGALEAVLRLASVDREARIAEKEENGLAVTFSGPPGQSRIVILGLSSSSCAAAAPLIEDIRHILRRF